MLYIDRYLAEECIGINEPEDRDLIDNFIFKAIISSALINKHGVAVILKNNKPRYVLNLVE